VLIADDHEILADMLRGLLQPEFEVVATVNDGLALIDHATQLQPDLVIVDVSMPRCSGIEAARRIHALHPPIRLVFLTMQDNEGVAAEAFAAGASGYLLKSQSTNEFLQALRHVMANGRYLTPAILRGDIAALPAPTPKDPLARISLREREVLGLLVSGLPMKAVARRLGITPRTVAFHKYKVMETLGLKDNAQLLEFALRHGLLNGEGGTSGR
jgi:DNA-binding NarL/FixJ family response regulator